MTESLRQVLFVSWDSSQRRPHAPCDSAVLQARVEKTFGSESSGFDHVLAMLVEQGLLVDQSGQLSLSDAGAAAAAVVHHETFREGFEAGLVRLFSSDAHRQATLAINGTGLRQLNMVDAVQLSHMCDALALKPGERVVDLGCATGVIAEHLSDQFGVLATGVDFARPAIAAAQERTVAKSDRLTFGVQDLNNLALETGSFDVALSVDTLYFVTDLTTAISSIRALVQPGGRIGIFWSQNRPSGHSPSSLESDNTDLAVALRASNLTWSCREFTEEAQTLWARAVDIYSDLKDVFAAEGNADLWEELSGEATVTQEAYQSGRVRRYFYVVSVPAQAEM